MPESRTLSLADEGATAALGQALARAWQQARPAHCVVWLHGSLGAGKTTLVRAWIQGLGHAGRVPSPTYTLIEPYELDGLAVRHVDLYRLAEPGEADYLGLGELAGQQMLWLIEWPERALGHLPAPDLELFLDYAGPGRTLRLSAATPAGAALLAACEFSHS